MLKNKGFYHRSRYKLASFGGQRSILYAATVTDCDSLLCPKQVTYDF